MEVYTPFGLKVKELDTIVEVLKACEKVEQVYLYGSRAMGTHRHNSDIDLVLDGDELTYKELAQLTLELDDLNLPYKIDLSILHHIDNPELKEHINRVGKKLMRTE